MRSNCLYATLVSQNKAMTTNPSMGSRENGCLTPQTALSLPLSENIRKDLLMTDPSLPESRTYRHRKCGTETTVSGQAFETISNPMSSMERTFCTACNAMFGISEYEWSDTGESIADYYARHSKSATPSQRFLTSKKFMVVLISMITLPAAGGAYWLMANNNWLARVFGVIGGLVIGAFIGMVVFVELFDKPIKRKVCGVPDTRVLK
jgi:hypothetical protein